MHELCSRLGSGFGHRMCSLSAWRAPMSKSMFWHMWVRFFRAATCSWLRGCVSAAKRSCERELWLCSTSTDLTLCC
jgi:hypothetical protein